MGELLIFNLFISIPVRHKEDVMMKLLIILLLVSGYTFADYKKVKDIKGIKIPKGISVRYDMLDNQYCISMNNSSPLEIRIKNTGKGFYPVVDIKYGDRSWLCVENSTIYIENQDILKFSYNWENRQTHVGDGGYIIEYIYSLDRKLFKFLSDNISEKSKLSVRFTGSSSSSSSSYRTHKLSKGDVKQLYSMLQLYKELTK